MKIFAIVLLAGLSLAAADWTMFGGDPQRTGWARTEHELTPDSVGQVKLLWKQTLENEQKSLTALTVPIVVSGVATEAGAKDLAFVAGSGDNVFALDVRDGSKVWERAFKSESRAASPGFWLCPKGLNATPTADVDKSLLYVISTDGRLYALDMATGKDRYRAMQVVPPFAKVWSLNRIGDRIYTSVSQNCGDTPSGVVMVDVSDPNHYDIKTWRSAKYAAGIWGRGGAIIGNDGYVYGATGDGGYDPAAGDYGESIVALDPETLELVDYFTPENWDYVRQRDFDIGTSPVAFVYKDSEYVAVGGKEGVIYLTQGARPGFHRMGGETHHDNVYTTPLVANEDEWFEAKGVWGGLSFYRDDEGRAWVYAPIWGPVASATKFPKTNGEAPDGSIAAFLVTDNPDTGKAWLKPAWLSGDFAVPEPVVIANGVIFALSNGENARQTYKGGRFEPEKFKRSDLLEDTQRVESEKTAELKALDATTGEELWSSGRLDGWTHFSGLALADGRIYMVDFENTVYCFGL